jgi:hypothetical protein
MFKEDINFSDKITAQVGKGFASEVCFKANMKIELFDKDGNVKEVRNIHNTVTTAGKAGLMDQVLDSTSLAKVGWMELGTGSPASTLLGAYISGSRAAFTTKTRLNAVVTMVGNWGAGVGTGAITEAGLFDVVTQNAVNMWCSASFAVINKGANDTLQITWTLSAT